MHKHLGNAIALAKDWNYDTAMDYHLCAVIVRGGSILSVGYNRSGRNGFVEHYAESEHVGVHAEVDAVLRVRRKVDLTGAKIYVARIAKAPGREAKMARPCEVCQDVLYAYGIRKAYYTIDENEFGVLKITNPNG